MNDIDQEPRVELIEISKSFGGVHALKSVSLKIFAGEILALCGENGAGKSTLMKVLTGAYAADKGEVRINGEAVRIESPIHGRKAGVGVIYQEFALANHLTVAENIYLNHISHKAIVNDKKIVEDANQIIKRLGFDLDPRAGVGTLTVAMKQVVEIAKALCEKAQVLILDEPSTVLAPPEIEQLHGLLRLLRAEGVGIVYVSHRLDEVFSLTDRVAVLKDGEFVGSRQTSELTMDELIRMMIGRSVSAMYPKKPEIVSDEVSFSAKKLTKAGEFSDISFDVRRGEILGFAGLVGSGRSEVMKAIFGAEGGFESGEVRLNGKDVNNPTVFRAVRNGFGLVPENRKEEGLLLNERIDHNITLPILHRLTNATGMINSRKERKICNEQVESLSIKAAGLDAEVGSLSGGNQQKVVLAKWFSSGSEIIIFDEPARGVDVGAKVEIYKLINEMAMSGKPVVVVSSEMQEVIGLCNRVLVMGEGEIRGELTGDDITEDNILRLAIVGKEGSPRYAN